MLDFTLTPAEMSEIASLKRPNSRVVNPAQHPEWDVVKHDLSECSKNQYPLFGIML